MPTINWAHMCDYAFTGVGGKANIIGEFENINSRSFPTRHPQIFVSLKIMADQGESFSLQCAINNEHSDRVAGAGVVNVNIPASERETVSHHFNFAFYNVEFNRPGSYVVEILSDNTLVHTIPLTVTRVD